MMKNRLTSVILLTVLFISCSSEDDTASTLELTQKIEADNFEVTTPSGWELVEDQGIDTYIGRIKNDETTIFFDQGYLSFGNLNNIQETSETIYFQRLEIDGVPAIIHKEKENRAEDTTNDTRLSVYLDDGDRQNRLYVLDSDNDDFFIKIFKSHKFID